VNKEPLLTFVLSSESQTVQWAAALATRCVQGDCILLKGDLGAGKTAFARGFIQALCGEQEEVTSPTFTLMQEYHTRAGQPLWHFDLYRLKNAAELEQLGMDDALTHGMTLIEWPEIAEERLPAAALTIELQHAGESVRRAVISGDPAIWKKRLEGLQ
jgi:tRNA threonylcarbamoyl adenosine modification protein YjeE